MKKFFTLISAALMAVSVVSAQEVKILDLTKSTTTLEFNATTGAWTETTNADASMAAIESQGMSFSHNAESTYGSWWGFTASNSADNSYKSDTYTYQFSNMAKGGIVLNEDGTVKTDENGAVVVSADVPYLVGYYSEYNNQTTGMPGNMMVFADGGSYEMVGCYVNLNSYSFYSLVIGDSYASAFSENDKFTLKITGMDANLADGNTVEVVLGSYSGGDLTAARGWKYVDLSSLGKVFALKFEMTSTDTAYGYMNTPAYFCLDKVSYKTATSGVDSALASGEGISYDRATGIVSLGEETFGVIYNINGQKVKAAEGATIDVNDLDNGFYVVKTAKQSRTIVKQ